MGMKLLYAHRFDPSWSCTCSSCPAAHALRESTRSARLHTEALLETSKSNRGRPPKWVDGCCTLRWRETARVRTRKSSKHRIPSWPLRREMQHASNVQGRVHPGSPIPGMQMTCLTAQHPGASPPRTQVPSQCCGLQSQPGRSTPAICAFLSYHRGLVLKKSSELRGWSSRSKD